MSSTVNVVCRNEITAVKTFSEAPLDPVTFQSKSSEDAYTASTAVPVTKESKFTVTLSSGTYTLDLTAVPSDTDGTFDGTGLKVQKVRFDVPTTNANKVVISQGGSNPYKLDGATTTWSLPIAPGGRWLLELDETGDDVGSGAKTILFTGTGAQTCKVHMVLG